jgi:gamma-glutamyltranspeptidase/glutathione hydrolase
MITLFVNTNLFRAARCGLFALGLAGCAVSVAPPSQPEGASGWTDKPGWYAKHFVVAAANPLATEAGYRVLKAGGSAVDAAIAVQMVLTLVEPQSSGIGGGAFLVHFDSKAINTFDGRETAPADADESLFLGPDGKPLGFQDVVAGGRSVGAPGVLRMLELAHRRYGRMPWATLFDPAIHLAENGFAVSERLHAQLAKETKLKADPAAFEYFFRADGTPKPVGTPLKNPALAATLREIAARGADAFYRGDIARDIVTKVRTHPTNPGRLSETDLSGYRTKERQPVCFVYDVYDICGAPPPSSGSVAIGQILGILEKTDIARRKPVRTPTGWRLDPSAVHFYSEAARLAYADRGRYIADPDFVPWPKSLLDKEYLSQRSRLIGEASMGKAVAGNPPEKISRFGDDTSPELPSTSHISIVDAYGNAVSMTTSIEDAFGSRLMVRGFLLNNQLTDFSFAPSEDGRPVANRVQPGKRPRSSMSPMLVLKDGKLVMATGSPGGSAIINYVAKTLIGTLSWGLNAQEAISLPNFGSRNGPTELEKGRTDPALIDGLKARGHDVRLIDQTSGIQTISRQYNGWFAGADPRREGVAMGD